MFTTRHYVPGTDGVCGSKSNVALYYNSTSQYMAFRFKDEHARSTFRILLTSAHTGMRLLISYISSYRYVYFSLFHQLIHDVCILVSVISSYRCVYVSFLQQLIQVCVF